MEREDNLKLPTTIRRRSIATSLAVFSSADGFQNVAGSARRRLSNVSDVVSRKISNTIGWRSVSTSIELTVRQGSALCSQYIRNRLKRSGIFQRKGLKNMKILRSDRLVVDDVYPVLITLGTELEKINPNLFVRIARQVGCGSFSEDSVDEVIADVSREMFRSGEMTWGKVIALFAVSAGIAVDCIRQGKPELIATIQRAMTAVLEDDLASWIQANGGWAALSARCRPPEQAAWHERTIVICIILTTVFLIILIISAKMLLI